MPSCDLKVLGTFQSPPPGVRAYVGVFYVNGPRLPPLSVFVPVPWPWQRSGPALAPQGMVAFKGSPRIAWHLWRATLHVLRVLAVTVACAPRARGPFDCCRARESTGDWCANMAHRRTGVCPFARNATEWVVHRSVFSGRSKTQSCSAQLDCLELWSAPWLAMQLKGWCTALRENFSLSISLSLSVSLCLAVFPSLCLFVSLSLCLSVSPSLCPFAHLRSQVIYDLLGFGCKITNVWGHPAKKGNKKGPTIQTNVISFCIQERKFRLKVFAVRFDRPPPTLLDKHACRPLHRPRLF